MAGLHGGMCVYLNDQLLKAIRESERQERERERRNRNTEPERKKRSHCQNIIHLRLLYI